jgi:hypothetical protein
MQTNIHGHTGINIYQNQNVPYATTPSKLLGDEFTIPTYTYVYRWEHSYSGNDNDWHAIEGAQSQHFQPWECWQTVYYRRVILHGSRRPVHVATSNVVTIIPYVGVTPGVYKIHNRNTGQVLEIGGGGSAPITDGTRANQWHSVGTANQEWNITATSTGVYKIINRNSGQGLEIGGSDWHLTQPGSSANQWPYWGGKNQQWLFQPVYGAQNYFVITNANSGQILEIGGGAPINAQAGAEANQWPYAGEEFYEQHWELAPVK